MSIQEMQNLYEVRKTVRFELKPNYWTLKKIQWEGIFKSPHFQSKIFIKSVKDYIAPQEREENFQFTVNIEELWKLIKECDEKINIVQQILSYLENSPEILWSVWIDPEKIKIIDRDLRYKLQEKKSWKKEFWNEILCKQSDYKVQWKKGSLFTLDDVDAYFDKVRSTETSDRKAGVFTKQVLDKIGYLLTQYEKRKKQLLIEENDSQNLSFLKKKELVARIRNFLGMFLSLERVLSLFVSDYKTEKQEFDNELKEIFGNYQNNLSENVSIIESIFKESDLYLHNNIQRRFSLNIRAINPNPESIDKTQNQAITEEKILEKIEELENEILDLKNRKATLKAERKEKWQNYKRSEWNETINALNPSNQQWKFSQLTELRRDLEEVKITHYAVLVEKEWNFFLAMENKRKQDNSIKKINEFSLLKLQKWDNSKALIYNSLTFKALRRLCLEEKSSMKTEYFLNKPNLSWKEQIGNGKRMREVNRKWSDEKYFDDLVKYLVFITKNNADKIWVSFSEDQYKEWKKCTNIDELENIINIQGYQVKWNNISWEDLLKTENIEIFQIFNKDFLLDEDFANSQKEKEKIERLKKAKEILGEKFLPKQQKEDRKQDLYTIYWNNFFKNKDEWRIAPEGKFYVRLKDGWPETQRKVWNDEKINKARFFENKILVDFSLVINSHIDKVWVRDKTKEWVEKHIESINKIDKENKEDFYILGIDRGLNSLVSYCLLDSNLEIIKTDNLWKLYDKNNEGYKELKYLFCGDWSLINSKWDFVKREDCQFNSWDDLKAFFIDVFKKLKKYYEFEKNNDFGVTEYIAQFKIDNQKNKFLEFWKTQDKIRFYILSEKDNQWRSFKITSVKQEIQKWENKKPLLDNNWAHIFLEKEEEIFIIDERENKVFDYVLSFYTEKAKRIFSLQKQKTFDSSKDYTEEELEELLFESSDDLKEWFSNFIIGKITYLANRIKQKWKKLYIVLEDLSNYWNNNKEPWNNLDDKSFKEEEHQRNLSVIIYQKLENNLVKKFNFIEIKDKKSLINKTQLSPNIRRIEDIKDFQSKNQLGNLLFVDPNKTSKECPNCGCTHDNNREKVNPLLDYIVCKWSCGFSTKQDGDKKGFSFIDGWDTLAAYNIAKKGKEYLESLFDNKK